MDIKVSLKSTGETLMICDLWRLVFSKLYTGAFSYSGRIDDLKIEAGGCDVPLPKEYEND